MIIDFGRTHKGELLKDCPEKYLKWLASHEGRLAERNRWASRDAKKLLEAEKAEPVLVGLRPFGEKFEVLGLLPGSDEMDYAHIVEKDAVASYAAERYIRYRIMELNAFFAEYRSRVNKSGFSIEDRARLMR